MRKKIFALLIFVISALLFSAKYEKQRLDKNINKRGETVLSDSNVLVRTQIPRLKEKRFADKRILVKFKPFLPVFKIEEIIKNYEIRKLRKIEHLGISVLEIPEDKTVEEMIYLLNQNPDVEYAEPDYVAYILVTPNDTFFKYQYNLYNSGQRVAPPGVPGAPSGKERADIKATAAWEETKGDDDIVIAILDTGVELTHPDLKNKIFSSGRDFVNEDFDASDDNGHGTYVAGIAAAETNNSEGIAGVAWNCKILPVKVMNEDGEGYYSWIVDGLIWAVDQGAEVINFSIGGEASSFSLEEAVKYAYEKDVLIAAAAGNEGSSVLYPAAYDAYCLAVAASDYDDSTPDWSNYGPEVDVSAPGVWILSLWPENLTPSGYLPYVWGNGTSASTPHVSGFAALIKSIKPWLSAREIMSVIRYSADDINSSFHPGKDDFAGYGRINMEKGLVPIKIRLSLQN